MIWQDRDDVKDVAEFMEATSVECRDRKERRTGMFSALHLHDDNSHIDIVVGNPMVGIAVLCKRGNSASSDSRKDLWQRQVCLSNAVVDVEDSKHPQVMSAEQLSGWQCEILGKLSFNP